MRGTILVSACVVASCLASVPLKGLPQTANEASVTDARRKNVRAIADALKQDDTGHRDTSTPPGWKPPRTSWGDLDLEGIYTNTDEWGIPFERPPEFEGRRLESVTVQELVKLRQTRRDGWLERLSSGPPAEPGTIGWYD